MTGRILDLQDFIDYAVDMYTDLSDRLDVLESAKPKKVPLEYPIRVPAGSVIESAAYKAAAPGRGGAGWQLTGSGSLISKTTTVLGGITTVTGTLDLRQAKVLGLDFLKGTGFFPNWKLVTAAAFSAPPYGLAAATPAFNTPTSAVSTTDGARWYLSDFNVAGSIKEGLTARNGNWVGSQERTSTASSSAASAVDHAYASNPTTGDLVEITSTAYATSPAATLYLTVTNGGVNQTAAQVGSTPTQAQLIIAGYGTGKTIDVDFFENSSSLLKIGAGKIGFWAHTPGVQPTGVAANAAAIIAALQSIGIFG